MSIFDKIFGNPEEKNYKTTLEQISNPLLDKIDMLEEGEVRDFFKVILDAAERSLRGILFMAPNEFNFSKEITKEEIDLWLHKVSLALIAYSFYFFSVEEQPPLGQLSYETYWQRMFDSYNRVFHEKITINDINHYAAGLKEDTEKGYSKSGNMERGSELAMHDAKTVGAELFQVIWKENVESNEKKVLFLGVRIWQAYQQIVQSFLIKLQREY